jgi:hypothetical protein
MNVAAPLLCPYSIESLRDDGKRGVLAVTAFKIAGREMPLHQESAAPGRSRATSMRRPPRVKRFSWSCQPYSQTADQREARLASSLSFLERFFVRPSIQPIADQREAHIAAIPNSQITDSPYFHPHSLWSYRPGASWVSSIGNGCCRLGAELNVSVSGDVVPGACRSHPNSAICC